MITADELQVMADGCPPVGKDYAECIQRLARKVIAAEKLAAEAEHLADSAQLEWAHDWPKGKDPISTLRAAITAYREASQ